MMNEINPPDILQRLLHGWWLISLLMIVGAMGGYAAAELLPPTYDARAEYYVGLDEALFAVENRLEDVKYTDRKEQLSAVSSIFYGEDVIAEVLRQAAERDIDLPDISFWRLFHIDRFYTTWVLYVRHTDPETAAGLVNIWVETADVAVQEAFRHAQLANQLNLEMTGLQTCFSTNDLASGNFCAGASFSSVSAMTTYLDDLAARLDAEWDASRGLSYASRLELIRRAETPAEPSRNQSGILLLAGCGLGWLAGLALVIRSESKGGRR